MAEGPNRIALGNPGTNRPNNLDRRPPPQALLLPYSLIAGVGTHLVEEVTRYTGNDQLFFRTIAGLVLIGGCAIKSAQLPQLNNREKAECAVIVIGGFLFGYFGLSSYGMR
jgi:hypothetical protein